MTADHAADGRQPNTGAGEFLNTVKALKCGKQLVGVSHVKAGAVVRNKKYLIAIRL